MPFYISYSLLTGPGSRIADTAAGALIACNELRSIGAGAVTIRDQTGRIIGMEELTIAATPPSGKRERDGDAGG
jgi:hypothetical protein